MRIALFLIAILFATVADAQVVPFRSSRIITIDNKNGVRKTMPAFRFGTAVCIKSDGNKSLFLTAGHNLHADASFSIGTNNKWHKAAVLKSDALLDLALVSADVPMEALEIAEDYPKSGDGVVSSGFPHGAGHYVLITGAHMAEDRNTIKVYMPYTEGMSGGAVQNKDHELIGLITMSLRGKCVGEAVGMKSIRRFLKGYVN